MSLLTIILIEIMISQSKNRGLGMFKSEVRNGCQAEGILEEVV